MARGICNKKRALSHLSITIAPFDALTDEQRQAWLAIHQQQPERRSPYFHPQFSALVHELNGPVEVAVIEQGGERGFLPFQRQQGTALAVGHPMNDYEGLIGTPGLAADPAALLKAMGVKRIRCFHLYPWDQPPWSRYRLRTVQSPLIDVTGGLEAYRQRQSKSGKSELSATRRKTRKLEREVGKLEFTLMNRYPAWLDQMIEWKRLHYQRTGAADNFAVPWRAKLLQRLLQLDDPGLRLVTSTLRLDGNPLAVHVGIQAGSLLHSWFPSYDTTYARFSPGRILMSMMIDQAESGAGIREIDLGKGEAEYKLRLMTNTNTVAEASIEPQLWRVALHRQWLQRYDQLRDSRFFDLLRQLKRRLAG